LEEYESTFLWRRSLGDLAQAAASSDLEKRAISRLSSAYQSFRDRAGILAAQIAVDVPDLTIHDLSHIEALWGLAEKIIGPEASEGESPYLNGLEAFILGAAFLVHDLAQSRKALGMTDAELAADPRFIDILENVKASGVPHDQTHAEAIGEFLRENHAELSRKLLISSWEAVNGSSYFLLDDLELRANLGPVIGAIAASHHMAVKRLQREFPVPLCPPAFCPDAWSCDSITLACMLRTADAAHLDARRAPSFVSAMQPTSGTSRNHWVFQNHLSRVMASGDRLIYTCGLPFSLKEADAWWLCFDSLSYVDKELKAVDALLADIGKSRFKVTAVAGIEEPGRLSTYIPTAGWVPVDTRIRVGDVGSLVQRLGGNQLYGNNLTAPLRELLQNACDAVRARRLFDEQPDEWGEIKVSLSEKDGQWYLSVTDTGIGMSVNVMTGALLDFGTSFWNSAEARKEFPGLTAKQFSPTGRYGIGFFSIFMLGRKVKVLSRRFDLGQDDARVLEFREGVGSRPLLREADIQERRLNGTSIEIVLDKDPYKPGGMLKPQEPQIPELSLKELCAWLCPTFPVTILVKERDGAWETAVAANDWLTLPALDLLNRIEKVEFSSRSGLVAQRREERSHRLRAVYDSEGKIVGRLSFRTTDQESRYMMDDPAVICVGGSRSDSLHSLSGVIAGTSERASRDRAKPTMTRAEFERWAYEQIALLEEEVLDSEQKASVSPYLVSAHLSTRRLPIAFVRSGWVSVPELRQKVAALNALVILDVTSYGMVTRNRKVELSESVVVCDMSFSRSLFRDGSDSEGEYLGVRDLVHEIIAEAWAMDEETAESALQKSDDEMSFEAVIGRDEYGNPVKLDHVDLYHRVVEGLGGPDLNLGTPSASRSD